MPLFKEKKNKCAFFKKFVKFLVLFFKKNPTTLLHVINSKHITEVWLHYHGNNKKNPSAVVARSNSQTTSGSKLHRTGRWD